MVATLDAASVASVDWQSVRERFPAAADCAYLNTASRGLLPTESAMIGQDYYAAMHRDASVALSSRWSERLESARATVARFIGAEPASIAFIANASTGLNLLAELLGEPGEVLMHRDEFPSVSFPWLQRDYPVRFLEPGPDGVVGAEQIEAAIGPRTRCIALSTVQYASGFAANLMDVSALCREHGLRLICDATQAVGVVPTDVRKFRPDGLVFSGYKWACAGYGMAALYVAPEHLDRPRPAAGWRSARAPYELVNDRVEPVRDALGFELGNPLMPGPLVLASSLELLSGLGIEAIESRVRGLSERLRTGLASLGLVIRSPANVDARGGITMFEHSNPGHLLHQCSRASTYVSERQGLIRVSPHFYNTEADIDRLLDVLTE